MSVARTVNAERLVLFGWSRAILLQLAHPLIAAGVAEHSTFRTGPVAPVVRLHHTVRAMLALTFGDPDERARTLESIRAIHRRVHGRLADAVGVYSAGTPYSAEDPELLLWVHATLLDSLPLTYERFVEPLSEGARDVYCQEAADVAVALGAHDHLVPRSWKALLAYLDAGHEASCLAVGAQARELAERVLYPPFAWAFGPMAAVNRLVTIGLLPARIRSLYGFEWTRSHERRFVALSRFIHGARQRLPEALATWPEARRKTRGPGRSRGGRRESAE